MAKIRLKRGLRNEFEQYAVELRTELGISSNDPLCPRRLALHLDIPIVGVSELPAKEANIWKSLFAGRNKFFGSVIPIGASRRGILHNDYVSKYRQNADIAHELSHIIIGHPLQPPGLENETSLHDSVLEHEARELSMTLLIPKHAALFCVQNGRSTKENCKYYGVSKSLLEYRIRITNARNWARNRSKYIRK